MASDAGADSIMKGVTQDEGGKKLFRPMRELFLNYSVPPRPNTHPLLKADRRQTCLAANVCPVCSGGGDMFVSSSDMRLICRLPVSFACWDQTQTSL